MSTTDDAPTPLECGPCEILVSRTLAGFNPTGEYRCPYCGVAL